jgi:hypothetical protein
MQGIFPMKKPELLILLLALLATAAKLYCAFMTIGSADIYYFHQIGQVVSEGGIIKSYEHTLFNQPPLFVKYLGFVYDWAKPPLAFIAPDVRVPGFVPAGARVETESLMSFASYIRVPCIAADLAVVLALLWVKRRTGRPSWWALGLLAVSPVSFMVSGYHGNLDPLVALGVTLAAVSCVAGQPMLCGIFLGLACQVKIIPALVGPAFFFFWLHRGKGRPFAIGAIVCVLAGWIIPLCEIPGLFFHRVIAYNSFWGWWGFPYLIELAGGPKAHTSLTEVTTSSEAAFSLVFKIIIIAAVIALAWRRRASTPVDLFFTLALSWAVFFVFAPGFGVQYLVWLSPFLLMGSERWFAIYTAAASIALFMFYTLISKGLPWYAGFTVGPTMNQWRPWLLLPWGALLAFLAASVRESLARQAGGQTPGPAFQVPVRASKL